MSEFRVEKDSMGEIKVPSNAYYGAQTQRAFENFQVSNLRFSREFIAALGLVKQMAAKVNADLGLLDSKVADAIAEAAGEVIDGKFDHDFVVDIFQTGSGTSTNMNSNEIISKRANELYDGDKGPIHPNDHVNFGQSSNDVIPTAIRIASVVAAKENLIPSLKHLHKTILEKGEELKDVVKTGRTHLMDAMPVTIAQEFGGYAVKSNWGLNELNRPWKDYKSFLREERQ